MTGQKTHDAQIRTFERKEGLPKARDRDAELESGTEPVPAAEKTGLSDHRVGAFPSGTNRESRDHNKHNEGGERDQKPRKHNPAEEKS